MQPVVLSLLLLACLVSAFVVAKGNAPPATAHKAKEAPHHDAEDEDEEEAPPPPVKTDTLVVAREILDGEAQKTLDWLLSDSPFSYLMKKAGGPWSDTFFGYTSVADPTPLVQRTPLIIIPSLTGNALEARLEGRVSKHWWCTKNYFAWYRLFLDLGAFIPKTIDCWFESIALQWDPATQLSANATGVGVRPRDFGGLHGVDYVDQIGLMGLYNDTIAVLTALGYTPGKDLRAATYDWRLSPYQLSRDLFPRIKDMTEEVYRVNGNKKVAFVSLSMGGAAFHLFLASMTQEWKDTYVQVYFSLDGAIGGSLSAAMTLLTDKSFYGYALAGLGAGLVGTIRTWPAIAWMMPWVEVFGNDRVFVYTPTKNYTARDFPALLRHANATQTAEMLESITNRGMTKITAPGVPTYCIHGNNVPTILALRFNTTNFEYGPETIKEEGDGTVPLQGLNICKTWEKEQKQPAIDVPVRNMFHGSSAHNKDVISFLVSKLLV